MPSGFSRYCLALAGALYLLPGSLRALEPTPAPAGQGVALGPHLEYLEDPTGELTLDDVRAPQRAGDFRTTAAEKPGFGYTDSAYWIRFRLRNPGGETQRTFLELVSLIDSIRLYEPAAGGYRLRETGRWSPLSSRDLVHRNFVFVLELPPHANRTYYMRFRSEGSMLLPLTLWSAEGFRAKDHEEQLFFGLYFGIMLVMFLYNCFLLFSVRDLNYLYYVCYLASFTLLQAALWGFGHEYLWPERLWWANRCLPFFIASTALFSLLFCREFLQSARARVFDRFLILLCVLAGAGLLLAFFAPYRTAIRYGLAVALLAILVILIVTLVFLARGFRAARLFALAWSFFLLGSLVLILRNLGVLPFHFLTSYSPQIGSALEVVFLSLALADRINILKRENESVQREALATQTRMTESFARFVPREFLSILGRDDLAGVEAGDATEREMTVLFSDIRSFTELSETMTPRENYDFINAYLRRISPAIRENGGFIDKFIGDAVMALFDGGPAPALTAARAMSMRLEEYNRQREAEGFGRLSTGVGLHTGRVMLGMIGEERRLEGTVISDAVNLTARIEGLTRRYGAHVLVSETVVERLDPENRRHFRFLDRVRVRGKKQDTGIFEYLSADPPDLAAAKRESLEEFAAALRQLHAGERTAAAAGFRAILERNPADGAARHFLERAGE